ncbi:MAG: sulfatase modifying factor 1 [Patiriisocius sp.]|jgi:sulfatase modifying factor 1
MTKRILIMGSIVLLLAFFGYQLLNTQIFDTKQVQASKTCLVPTGMAFVKGGDFTMGAGAVYPEEMPAIQMVVQDFYMDRHEVTNFQFAEFIEATGYITMAQRVPNAIDYPDIPAELLTPGSAVFVKLSQAVEASTFLNWWHFTEGANWKNPLGPNSNIMTKENFPVIHIAYDDALAYAQWKGHRLPTEAEYEYASRGGLEGAKYETGSTLLNNGKYIANTWQGLFPFTDTAKDGYVGLAPVACYPPNHFGIHDLIGNVWEWTQSVYYPRHFDPSQLPLNLPAKGYDEKQPGIAVGVIKGGSYLCAEDFCMRYRPAARHAQDTGLGTSHIGFRTVKDS